MNCGDAALELSGELGDAFALRVAYDRNQPGNESRYSKFWLEYCESDQCNACNSGRLWRPHCQMRKVKTVMDVTHDFQNSCSPNLLCS